ncbi:hypothetical protein LINPERPRIM_LOCUS28851 [Linum perenne]
MTPCRCSLHSSAPVNGRSYSSHLSRSKLCSGFFSEPWSLLRLGYSCC